MGVSGFPIKEKTNGDFDINEPWFQGITGVFATIIDNGFTQVQLTGTATPAGISVGDIIWFIDTGGTPEYAGIFGTITAFDNDTIDIDTTFTNTTAAGTYAISESITWDEDTPEDELREIHVQFDTTSSVQVEVTSDGGLNWMNLNNITPLKGLATLTMFVIKSTLLNYRSTTATTASIVVTAA